MGIISLLNCFCIFLTPIFCVCVHRSRLHGLHLVHPGRQAGQGPPMWLVSHPWLRWRNQTPTWKVRYLTSQDYTHHLMQNLNEALWSYASLFIRLAQIAHDCAVKRKQFFCESLNMSTLFSLFYFLSHSSHFAGSFLCLCLSLTSLKHCPHEENVGIIP